MNFRIDIVLLSTETKPTENLTNGTTCYEVDTYKFFIWYKGTWYEQNAEPDPEPANNGGE